jgi:hypothetical protein
MENNTLNTSISENNKNLVTESMSEKNFIQHILLYQKSSLTSEIFSIYEERLKELIQIEKK